jgi:predicted xylose isomerase-like sugar epimerase
MTIVTAEEAAEMAGRMIAEGDRAVVLCPLPGGRWHVAQLTTFDLAAAAGAVSVHHRSPGLASKLYPSEDV